MTIKQQLEKMKIGEIKDVIFSKGIARATKEVEKVDENAFYIHCFSSGWRIASLNLNETIEFIQGKINPINLNWN